MKEFSKPTDDFLDNQDDCQDDNPYSIFYKKQ